MKSRPQGTNLLLFLYCDNVLYSVIFSSKEWENKGKGEVVS